MILEVAPLTPSGRPVLQPGEVEVVLLDKVDLEYHPVGGLAGQQAEAYKNGYAILTTRRLIWVDAGGGGGSTRAAALPLSAVAASSKKVQYGIKGSKVRLVLEVYTDTRMQPVPVSGFHTNLELLGLRCRGPAPDAFKIQLDEQVRQAAAAAAAAPAAGGSANPTPGGGNRLPPAYMSPLSAGLQGRTTTTTTAAGAINSNDSTPEPPTGRVAAAAVGAAGPGGGGGASPQAGALTSPGVVQPDPALLQHMVEMGFPRNRAARSLVATRNQGAQEAIDYLLAFGDQPGMDDPWDASPGPAATTAAARPGAGLWGQPLGTSTLLGAPVPAAAYYPPVLPAFGFGGVAAPYPYSPQPGMPPAPYYSPYGAASAAAVAYGGPGSAPPGSPSHAISGFPGQLPPPTDRMQQLGLLQHQYQHQHPYGSSPDLRSAELAAGGAAPLAIGVAGIVKREQQKTAETGRAVEDAFRDLSALMASAATMVALAEKFRGVLGADGAVGAASGGGDDPLLLDAETQQQLIALGISSPVTRLSAGARYHIELSRQLADFLAVPLQRVGGLMSLPDVYCLFNRARGTELVSPDDLLQAAKLFGRAGVTGLKLRTLTSGVLVVQGPQHSDEQVCARIAELTNPQNSPKQGPPSPQQPPADGASPAPSPGEPPPQPSPPHPPLGPGLTASDVALALGGISVAIAAEHLLTAEARGVVCRDDGPEGLRFYRNFFLQDRLGLTAATASTGLVRG